MPLHPLLMHKPLAASLLPFPIPIKWPFKPYVVAKFKASRECMHSALGAPHFVETDSTRTFGGDEDAWAWRLPTGQQLLVILRVPYEDVIVHCDPPTAQSAIEALGIDVESQSVQFGEPYLPYPDL
jgi:hypothetical protein